jgi:hypothetical protein
VATDLMPICSGDIAERSGVGRFTGRTVAARGWTAAQVLEHFEGRSFLGPFEQAAGGVEGAGAGASLGGGDEVEDSCSEPLEFDGGRVGTCAPAAVRGVATRLEDGRGEGPVRAAVLGETGAVVSLGEGGSVASLGEGAGVVVLGGCCTRVDARWPPPTPDETVNRPANTRTVNEAATTTAAPMTPAPTT